MSAINLSGNASGSGTFTIASPNSNTNYTLALPEEAGTITTSNSPYSTFRNRIINGDMRIDQRNAGAAVSTDSSYPVDRFVMRATGVDELVFTAQQDSSAPAGFVNSLKVTITTAETSFTATEQFVVRQLIEGNNISDLAWGTANAKTITLSFWVRSSLTGTFSGALLNSALNRSYPFTYTISVADTWEYKTVTIAGDTSGTWLTTNGVGISVTFALGIGPDRLGTAGAWNGNNNTGATGMVQLGETTGATFYITGVQLEVGSVATPFERRPYGTELSLCQRYYQFVGGETPYNYLGTTASITSTTTAYLPVPLQVTMRAAPTFTYAGALSNFDLRADGNATHTPTALANDQLTSKICGVTITTTGITANTPGILIGANSTASKLIFSAEL